MLFWAIHCEFNGHNSPSTQRGIPRPAAGAWMAMRSPIGNIWPSVFENVVTLGVSAKNPAVVNGQRLPLIELDRYRNTTLLFQSSEHYRVRQTGRVQGRPGY